MVSRSGRPTAGGPAPISEARLQAEHLSGRADPGVGAERAVATDGGGHGVGFRLGHGGVHPLGPAGLALEAGRVELRRPFEAGPSDAQARPRPVLGPRDQAGPQRIPLDVADDGPQMVVVLTRECLEPPLSGAPGLPVMTQRPPDVGRRQPVHPSREVLRPPAGPPGGNGGASGNTPGRTNNSRWIDASATRPRNAA